MLTLILLAFLIGVLPWMLVVYIIIEIVERRG